MKKGVVRRKDIIAVSDGYVSTFFTFTTDENAKEAMSLIKHVSQFAKKLK